MIELCTGIQASSAILDLRWLIHKYFRRKYLVRHVMRSLWFLKSVGVEETRS